MPSAGSERAYELLSKLLELGTSPKGLLRCAAFHTHSDLLLLCPDPAKRMTAEQALQHEYFRKVRDMVIGLYSCVIVLAHGCSLALTEACLRR